MLDQMPEREGAQRAQRGPEEPDWSEREERFGGQRVDSSGDETPSADCLSLTLHHLATYRTLRRWPFRSFRMMTLSYTYIPSSSPPKQNVSITVWESDNVIFSFVNKLLSVKLFMKPWSLLIPRWSPAEHPSFESYFIGLRYLYDSYFAGTAYM